MANIVQWLLPKEQKFFDMLKEQSSNALDGAKSLKSLVDNYDRLEDLDKIECIKKIKSIEHKGDELAHEIIGILNKTFVTPIDKEDIHNLAMLLDDVIDLVHVAAERFVIFRIEKVDGYIKKLTEIALDIINRIDEGILEVSKLKNMREFYIDVHTLENKGDDVFRAALVQLFDKKDVVDIIKYKEIYELLENVIDKCEHIANVIESIVVKHA